MWTSSRDWSRRHYGLSLGLVAAFLWPAIAGAAEWNPTASDSHQNTAAGSGALNSEAGNYNMAAGYYALHANTTGAYNTASGYFALSNNTTGTANVASGANALRYNATGNYNTANGYSALYNNGTGGFNTASGAHALFFNTTGGFNTAVGYQALLSNGTGNNNTVLGYQALQASVKGSKNVAIGAGALSALTAGGGNIALGANAGSKTVKGGSDIYIGNPGLVATESDTIRIGDAQTRTFIAGIADAPMSGATVVIKSNGRLGVVASSARYKQDIKALDDTARKLAQLRPVSFRYKAEPDATHYGLIAEEVDQVMPELVVRDEKKRPESVQYLELIPLLLQQWKAQQMENARQRAENVQQRELIARLEAKIEKLSRSRLAAAMPNR
jgi:hypothetical protein